MSGFVGRPVLCSVGHFGGRQWRWYNDVVELQGQLQSAVGFAPGKTFAPFQGSSKHEQELHSLRFWSQREVRAWRVQTVLFCLLFSCLRWRDGARMYSIAAPEALSWML